MTQLWFIPCGLAIAVLSTRTALSARPGRGAGRDHSWWILLILGWLPMACWAFSQFIVQD